MEGIGLRVKGVCVWILFISYGWMLWFAYYLGTYLFMFTYNMIVTQTLTNILWFEEGLRGSEPLVTDSDDLSVRELIALLKGGRGSSGLHLGLKVQGNVAQLLLK